jgi:hypothetical protein
MLGAVPLLLHTPVWCAQGQLYQTEGKEFYLSVAYQSMHLPDDTTELSATTQCLVIATRQETVFIVGFSVQTHLHH